MKASILKQNVVNWNQYLASFIMSVIHTWVICTLWLT